MWFGLLCGSAISIMVNLSLIIFIFHEWAVFYFPAPLCILLALFFLKSDNWNKFAIAILFVLAGFVAAEIIIIDLGIIRFFYYIRDSDATRISKAFGLLALINYIIHFIFFVIGTIIAGILTGLEVRKLKNLARKPYNVSALDETILLEIKDSFVSIRYYAFSKDEISVTNGLIQLEEKCTLINRCGTAFQKSIFNYCLHNLKQLFEKRQYEILYDFADAVHNLPDIFSHEYNLKQYWNRYVKPLRKKHGNHFFSNYQQVFKGMNTSLINAKQ